MPAFEDIPFHKLRPLYRCWSAMKARCNNPENPSFKHYGARGIRVCERWNSFEAFAADMGPRPLGFSIERIDNDGGYEPGNCKWIPLAEQAKNKRRRQKTPKVCLWRAWLAEP